MLLDRMRDAGLRLMATTLVALAFAGMAMAGTLRVSEKAVRIATSEGWADAALAHPAGKGRWPAILLWPDYGGLRPLYRGLARRLAAEGFVVLVPNSFYRSAPPREGDVDPDDPAIRPALLEHRAKLSDEAVTRDSLAYLAYLNAQRQVDRRRRMATIGYELGASYAVRTAAASPDRIGAVGSIYGLSVATPRANSPHLLIPRTRAAFHIAIARDHDAREPDDKTDLRNATASAGLRASIIVYPADQGWANPASKAHDPVQAERAFQALVALCRDALRLRETLTQKRINVSLSQSAFLNKKR